MPNLTLHNKNARIFIFKSKPITPITHTHNQPYINPTQRFFTKKPIQYFRTHI